MSKKIVLIAPPRYEKEIDNFLPQNLGLGYIASFLGKKGYQVFIIDGLAEGWHIRNFLREHNVFIRGLSFDQIIGKIPSDTNFVGITVPFVASMRIATQLARFVKEKYPDIMTVLGGISPSIDPRQALSAEGVDYVVRGGGEIPMLALVSGISPEKIKGLVFEKGSRLFDNGRAETIEDLDTIPFPARHLLPMCKYISLSGRGRRDLRTASMLTSRGCSFDCAFCAIHHIYGYKWRGRSPQNVLEEIKYLINEYGIEHIEFEDDNLTLDINRAEEIFDGLIKMNKKIKWSTPNGVRIDTLNKPLLTKMKRSGCSTLFLSIESGDPEVLKIMNKQLDLKKVEEVVKACGELDINTNGIFIVGYPGETAESFKKTATYITRLRKIGLVGAGASIAKAYPGTKLRQMCEKENLLTDRERYSKGFPLGEYVDIKTDYFSEEEVYYRLDYIKRRLNPLRFYTSIFGVTNIIKKIFPQWFIDLVKRKAYALMRQ